MKIDPNRDIELSHELVLCQSGAVVLHTGERTALGDLERADSPFQRFCRGIDPNRCFIVALVPEDSDRAVFFRARDLAQAMGVHMQAPIDTPENARQSWAQYVESKASADPAERAQAAPAG